MGETVLPTVEESSPQLDEPPICGSKDPHKINEPRQLQPNPSDGNAAAALHAPHTLSFQEVAEKLRVDIE
jgi:Na+-exporting ATPase